MAETVFSFWYLRVDFISNNLQQNFQTLSLKKTAFFEQNVQPVDDQNKFNDPAAELISYSDIGEFY